MSYHTRKMARGTDHPSCYVLRGSSRRSSWPSAEPARKEFTLAGLPQRSREVLPTDVHIPSPKSSLCPQALTDYGEAVGTRERLGSPASTGNPSVIQSCMPPR